MPGGFYNKSSVGDREAIVDFARSIFNWQVSIIHVDSGVGASFPAFITDYSETFQSDWNEETYFGRNDKVGRHAGTSRTINLSLELPAYSALDSRINTHQIDHLVATMYPSYREVAGQDVLSAYPLVKVKFANLIRNSNVANSYKPLESGLAGWIPNLTLNPVLESGFHSVDAARAGDARTEGIYGEDIKGGVLYPKVWQLSFSLRVAHEHKLGWKNRRWISRSKKFPYGAYTGFTEKNDDYGTAVLDREAYKEILQAEMARILRQGEGSPAGNRYGLGGAPAVGLSSPEVGSSGVANRAAAAAAAANPLSTELDPLKPTGQYGDPIFEVPDVKLN